ncbi:carboxypeptidase-like regulatory domain-containing protein [Fuerstiella marisgermanici]|uniref:Cna protein B-type domain protein n=1 Tax=Fuerstiella marisgermanici TaxID=1891926 RepID=A0A1P8WQ65_9PLAN|nr:carboxypeptidase-like regulatory domain-containing protein [Fuerstiella marisgermanici]APZ96198.1 hypothetical protein Fuma_05866 [Fuerstiella marisgermanici]
MKFLKSAAPFCVLGLALCVTSSSIYVTVKAAAQPAQVADEALTPAPVEENPFEFAPPADASSPAAPGNVPPVPLPMTQASVNDEILSPDEVRNDRQHQVQLDANGAFNGRLSALTRPDGNLAPAAGAKVRVVSEGAVVASAITNDDGGFQFTGLSEGVVAIIATGPDTLLLHSVRLVANDAAVARANTATPVSLESDAGVQLELNSAVVSGSDIAVARRLIFEGLPENDRRFLDVPSPKEESYPFGQGESSTSLSHHQVQLRPDGTLVGLMNLLDTRTGRIREVMDLTVYFVRDGELVGSTDVQPSGEFVMAGLAPGVYSVVTNGSDGVIALGVDIVGAVAGRQAAGKYKLTSIAQGLDLAVAPVNAQNFNRNNAAALTDGDLDPNSDPGTTPPIAGGGVPGGGFGPIGPGGGGGFAGGPGGGFGGGTGGGSGGGFGGGGGGLGALLGAGIGAGIGYAVADDNDNKVASPDI